MRGTRRLSVGLVAAALTLLAAPATGHASTGRPGDASATAQLQTQGQGQAVLARVVPYVGLPGTTTSIGLTGAQVDGEVARASAAAADFGLLGALATAGAGGAPPIPGAPAPSLPTPITADSTGQTSAERNPFAPPGSSPAGTGAAGGQFAHEKVSATAAPALAVAEVTGPALRIPGLLEITGGVSRTVTDAARSVSEVTIDRIGLGDGQVELSGLRWTATQDGGKPGTSTFTLGGLTVAGQQVPVAAPEQVVAGLSAANEALISTGLVLSAPSSTGDTAGAAAGPLILQVRNPDPLVDPSRQVTDAVKPVLAPLVEGFIAAYPDAAAAQIVVNAATGAAGGSSGGRLELGGVSARSTQVEILDLTQPIPDAPTLDTGSPAISPAAGPPAEAPGARPGPEIVPAPPAAALPGSAGRAAPVPDPSAAGAGGVPAGGTGLAPSTSAVTAAASAPAAEGSGPGIAVLALGIGLAAVLLLAAGDRVRIRGAQ